jgi:putative SOS response-associated peptidase YedK
MCGRIGFSELNWSQLVALMRAEVMPEHQALFRPRYNLAPTQQHWIVCQSGRRRQLLPADWGFRGSRSLLINARSETAPRLPVFRQAFAAGRCVVPADGFYEWQGTRGRRIPLWFYPRQGPLLMAGLFRREANQLSFVILTTAANESLRFVHSRMPALLSVDQAAAWLDAPDGSLLRPAPDDWLERRRVTTRVNSIENDDRQCQEAASEPAGPDQLEFGLA